MCTSLLIYVFIVCGACVFDLKWHWQRASFPSRDSLSYSETIFCTQNVILFDLTVIAIITF